MTDQVKKLAIIIHKEYGSAEPLELASVDDKYFAYSIAEFVVLDAGYIPKDSVLELLEVCPRCKGIGDVGVDYIDKNIVVCNSCQGKGIVLRGEKCA